MIPTLQTTLIAALISLVMGFGGGWLVEGWRMDAKDVHRIEAQATKDKKDHEAQTERERLAHVADIKREEAVIAAQNEANARAVVARRDATSARGDRDRVLLAADAAIAAARVSHQACLDNAATLADVFKLSVIEYQSLGEKADGHVNDVRLLSDSFPVK